VTNDATYTARPESWAYFAACDPGRASAADCLMELLARVERLEHKQRDSEAASQVEPAPSTPAGQGELVRCVAKALSDAPGNSEIPDWTPEAIAAILAVADWCDGRGMHGAAEWLRREVGR
jgi:hypothetical protein